MNGEAVLVNFVKFLQTFVDNSTDYWECFSISWPERRNSPVIAIITTFNHFVFTNITRLHMFMFLLQTSRSTFTLTNKGNFFDTSFNTNNISICSEEKTVNESAC